MPRSTPRSETILSKSQNVQLVDRRTPVLALDDPDNVEPDLMRPYEDVDFVRRPHPLHGVIGGGVEPQTPKERRDLFLILPPRIRLAVAYSVAGGFC